MKICYDKNDITTEGMEFLWDDFKDEFIFAIDGLMTICPGLIITGRNMNWQGRSFRSQYDADLNSKELLKMICNYDPVSIEVEGNIKTGVIDINFSHHDGNSCLTVLRPSRKRLKQLWDIYKTEGICGNDIHEFDNLNKLLRYYGHSI